MPTVLRHLKMPRVQKISLKKCKFPGCDYRNKYHCRIKMHERVHNPERERPYGCKLCKFSANLPAGLKRHLIVHSEETPYVCSVAGCEFKSKHRNCLLVHKKFQHSSAVQELPCSFEECDYQTKRIHNLRRHIEDCHSTTKVKTVQCPMCSKRYFSVRGMQEHLSSHTNEKPWRCSLCNFETTSEPALCLHEERRHGKFRESRQRNLYKCNVCSFTTTFRNQLDRHLDSHSQDRPYACTIAGCSYRAKRKDTLKLHVSTHGLIQYPCSVTGCTYVAKTPRVLQYHNLTRHGLALPFTCAFPDCKARFSTEVALTSHQRVHDSDRPHECDGCLRRFKTKSNLNNHILHAHDKPQRYQCTLCEFGASRRSRRNAHVKTVHRMEEVFFCSEPGCRFRSCSEDDLHAHRKTRHSAHLPFKCKYCLCQFGLSSCLEAHLRRKHSDMFQHYLTIGRGHPQNLSCQTCGRAFPSQVSLLKHSIQHHQVAVVMLPRIQVCLC